MYLQMRYFYLNGSVFTNHSLSNRCMAIFCVLSNFSHQSSLIYTNFYLIWENSILTNFDQFGLESQCVKT